MASGKINVLGLIGTSKTANALKKQHPHPNRLRCVLGLEAKNPAIVLEGADLDLAVRECVLGCLSFNGQRCTALKIIFVEAGIADAFLDRFAAAVNALTFGIPWQEGVFITPVAEKDKFSVVQRIIDTADFSTGKVNTMDGIRVDFTDGWGLVRASNTSPSLTARFEADNEEALEVIKGEFRAQIALVDPSLELNF